MAWYDEYELDSDLKASLDDIIGDDTRLEELFDAALFDHVHGSGGEEHQARIDELADYLLDHYGIDLDEDFDWDGWREWYEGG